MLKFGALGSAVLGMLLSVSSLAGEATKSSNAACGLTILASLDLYIAPNGKVHVPVTINGTPAWMALVTSSALTMISEDAVTSLKLKRQAVNNTVGVKVGDTQIKHQVTLDTFMVGNVLYKRAVLIVNPRKGPDVPQNEVGKPVVGVLGINAFDDFDFELNLAAKKLNLFSHDHCPGKVVYWTKNYTQVPFSRDPLGVPMFPMELDGQFVEATLSTNTALSIIDSNITKGVYGFDETSPDVTLETTDDGREEARFKAMALSAPGLNVANTRLRLVKRDKDCGRTWRTTENVKAVGYEGCSGVMPLELGINVLTNLRIYVATKEKVIYISRADAT